MRGALKISGTTTTPSIAGMVEADSGECLIGSTKFDLLRAQITFDPEDSAQIDPLLDIVCEGSIGERDELSPYNSQSKIACQRQRCLSSQTVA